LCGCGVFSEYAHSNACESENVLEDISSSLHVPFENASPEANIDAGTNAAPIMKLFTLFLNSLI